MIWSFFFQNLTIFLSELDHLSKNFVQNLITFSKNLITSSKNYEIKLQHTTGRLIRFQFYLHIVDTVFCCWPVYNRTSRMHPSFSIYIMKGDDSKAWGFPVMLILLNLYCFFLNWEYDVAWWFVEFVEFLKRENLNRLYTIDRESFT